MAFIAGHADRRSVDGLRWGVEPICLLLTEHGVPVAPSTYYDAAKQRRPVTEEDLREERLMVAIARVHHENYGVYGARKVWLQLNREGVPVARCTVERLMTVLGLEGARRGRRIRTTRPDPGAPRPVDLVERNFNPARPDALWVADFTYVATWSGFVYVAVVLDAYSRRILGWKAATSMRTDLVLDALEMAIWARRQAGVADLTGLVAHTDAGSQYTPIRYTERLAEAGAAPSVGSVGDAYDNALAESEIGLFKTEVIRRRTPGRFRSCPHQLGAEVEARVLELRRVRPYWGPRRIRLELVRLGVDPVPSESGVYRRLVRAGVIDPAARRRRGQVWKRWERAAPNELWQMDVVGGFLVADGTSAKAVIGVDDHSRFCVSARLPSGGARWGPDRGVNVRARLAPPRGCATTDEARL